MCYAIVETLRFTLSVSVVDVNNSLVNIRD